MEVREEIDRNEQRFRQLSNRVDKNEMDDAEMAVELQGLQSGEERRGSNSSQAVDCCMETMVEQLFAMGPDQANSKFDAVWQVFFKKFEAFTPSAQMPGKGGEEGTMKTSKKDKKPVKSWCCHHQADAVKALQRVVWSLIFLVFGVHSVNAEDRDRRCRKG